MEADLAATGARKLHDLIGHLISSRRPNRKSALAISPFTHPEVRRLAEVELPDPERADIMWLQRIELRSPRAVADALEAGGFDQAAGLLSAIFVDSRCGLIRWQHFGAAASCDPARTAACILRSATACHAHGIILVISDPAGDLASAPRVRALSRTLQLKGEAIEIFLLDHFVLGANGCRRLAEMQVQGRHSR